MCSLPPTKQSAKWTVKWAAQADDPVLFQRQQQHHRLDSSCSSAATSSTDSIDSDDRCDSSLGLEEDRDFPVKILPHLFLGNAATSEDSEALSRHSIEVSMLVLRGVFSKHCFPACNFCVHQAFYFLVGGSTYSKNYMQQMVQDCQSVRCFQGISSCAMATTLSQKEICIVRQFI